MIDLRLFEKALQNMLGTVTTKQVGVDKPLVAKPTLPYVVLARLPSTVVPQDQGQGHMLDIMYQITSVGMDPNQCHWMAGKVYDAILDVDSGGNWVNEITLISGYIIGRQAVELGGMAKYVERLYNLPDTYSFQLGE